MKKIITITGIVLAISISNISTAAIDSRGGESCSESRNAIKAAKNKLKRFKKYSRSNLVWEGSLNPKKMRKLAEDGWTYADGSAFTNLPLNVYKRRCKDDGWSDNKWCLRVERIELLFQDAKDEIADARDDYSLDGCATGGTINYNRN